MRTRNGRNYTDNYDLVLPRGTDRVNIDDLNSNFEVIDGQMKALENGGSTVRWNQIVDAPSSLPASDVQAWAKGQFPPSIEEIPGGLNESQVRAMIEGSTPDPGTDYESQIEAISDRVSDIEELQLGSRVTELEEKVQEDTGLFYNESDGLLYCRYVSE